MSQITVFRLHSWPVYYHHPPINHHETQTILLLYCFFITETGNCVTKQAKLCAVFKEGNEKIPDNKYCVRRSTQEGLGASENEKRSERDGESERGSMTYIKRQIERSHWRQSYPDIVK